jgi:hypothetical protein
VPGGSNSDRANPSSTSVALLPGSTTTKPTFLRTKPCSWHVIPFIRVIQAAFWCGFSKNSWRGLFCDSVKSCENYYFAIYWRGSLPSTCQSFIGQEGKWSSFEQFYLFPHSILFQIGSKCLLCCAITWILLRVFIIIDQYYVDPTSHVAYCGICSSESSIGCRAWLIALFSSAGSCW